MEGRRVARPKRRHDVDDGKLSDVWKSGEKLGSGQISDVFP
jgi:hypothetical protein